jgi:hypothetical protein
MNIQERRGRPDALTLIEVLAVLATVLIAAILLLPLIAGRGEPSMRSVCASNLKSLSLAEKTWRIDHGDRFPWQTSTNQGGTMEPAGSTDVFRHFQVFSNEIETGVILVCPSDRSRIASVSLASGFSNSNVSYFVGLNADGKHPESILHGDRNFTGGITNRIGMDFTSTNAASWDAQKLHRTVGMVVCTDGSVQSLTSLSLLDALTDLSQSNAVHLAIPRVPGE